MLESNEPTTDVTPATKEKHRQLLQTYKTLCKRQVYRKTEKDPEEQWMRDWEVRREQRQTQFGGGEGAKKNGNGNHLNFEMFSKQVLDHMGRLTFGGSRDGREREGPGIRGAVRNGGAGGFKVYRRPGMR